MDDSFENDHQRAPPVQGYHGTSQQIADTILKDGFRISGNEYDWLGDGVYFFQDAPQRAWDWATEHHPTAPAVVGADIRLIGCLDLLDPRWVSVLSEVYNNYLAYLKLLGYSRPRQTSGAHRLDREVINYTVGVLSEQGIVISCVRAAFSEGDPIYPDSALMDRAHVQIAVRDIEQCIKGIWLEPGPTEAIDGQS